MSFFCNFRFETCAEIPIFRVFFEKQETIGNKNAPKKKTITVNILQNTG